VLARNQNSTKQTYSRIKPLIGVFGLDTGTPRTPEFGAPLCRDHQERAGSHRVRGRASQMKQYPTLWGRCWAEQGWENYPAETDIVSHVNIPATKEHMLAFILQPHVGIYFAMKRNLSSSAYESRPHPWMGGHICTMSCCWRVLGFFQALCSQCSTTLPSYLNPRTKRTRKGGNLGPKNDSKTMPEASGTGRLGPNLQTVSSGGPELIFPVQWPAHSLSVSRLQA